MSLSLTLLLAGCVDSYVDPNVDPNECLEDNPEDCENGTPNADGCETLVMSAEEQAIYDDINHRRAERGLNRIPISPSLFEVARTHAKDSVEHPSISEDCSIPCG